ncbi:hypothetical protein LINPERHAP1_LOCUS9700 [Linum perenne]
MGLSSYRYIT